MTPAQIITTAREWSGTNSTQVDDSTCLRYLNIIKDDFWNHIVSKVNEDYSYEEWTTDTVANQGEYVLPLASVTAVGAKNVKEIYVAYSADTLDTGTLDYVRATEVSSPSMEMPWSWYEANQSQEEPIFKVVDSSVFIAPVPVGAEAGTGRLKVIGVRSIPNYTISGVDGAGSSTTEAQMRIPLDRHVVLIHGVAEYILRYLMKSNEADATMARYMKQRDEYCNQLSDRNAGPFYATYPTGENPVESPTKLIW